MEVLLSVLKPKRTLYDLNVASDGVTEASLIKGVPALFHPVGKRYSFVEFVFLAKRPLPILLTNELFTPLSTMAFGLVFKIVSVLLFVASSLLFSVSVLETFASKNCDFTVPGFSQIKS